MIPLLRWVGAAFGIFGLAMLVDVGARWADIRWLRWIGFGLGVFAVGVGWWGIFVVSRRTHAQSQRDLD